MTVKLLEFELKLKEISGYYNLNNGLIKLLKRKHEAKSGDFS